MQQTQFLPTIAYAAGGADSVSLKTLPKGKRLRKLLLMCRITGTKDAADALAVDLFAQFIALIRLKNYVHLPGWSADELAEEIQGRLNYKGAAIPGSGTTFEAIFALPLYFYDPRQPGADDGSIPTELLHTLSLEVTFAAGAVHGVGSLVATGGNIFLVAELVDGSDVPQICEMGYYDPGSQTVDVDPGVYMDLFLHDGLTPGTITEAEVSHVDMQADKNMVHNNVRHDQLVSMFNVECMRDQAADVAKNAATRLPIVWTPPCTKGLATKQPAVEEAGQIQLTGTMTDPRVVYRRLVSKDAAAVQAIGQATGAPANAVAYEPKTASKAPLRAKSRSQRAGRQVKKDRIATSVLGGKFRQSPTAGPMRTQRPTGRRAGRGRAGRFRIGR